MVKLMVWVVARDVGMACTTREYWPVNYASPTVFCLVAFPDGASTPAKDKALFPMTLVIGVTKASQQYSSFLHRLLGNPEYLCSSILAFL